MSRIPFILEQTRHSRAILNRIIQQIPDEIYYTVPKGLGTHIAWQIGHITLIQNFNAMVVIGGLDEHIKQHLPLREYVKSYSLGSKPGNNELDFRPAPEELRAHLNLVHEQAVKAIEAYPEHILDEPLRKTRFPHPIAKTKYEALTWSYRHEMWHAGQIAMLCRLAGHSLAIGG